MFRPKITLSICLLTALFAPLRAETIDFERDVFPIFADRCLDCHDADSVKGGVGLDTYFHAHQPADSGEPLFVSSKPDESLLIHVVEESDPDHRMPPKGDPLTAQQIDILRSWIEAGAEWPDDGWRPKKHWAYQPPVRPEVPAPTFPARAENEIDAFVFARLAEAGLEPNPEADSTVLLRRLYLDLTGLPPSVEEVDAFVANPSAEAYDAAVERLLSSPHFGEKWARHWLDLARYADSEGYQRDTHRNLWLFRDWVIQALNEDKPFDRFTIEQLAGDLLPNPTQDQLIATGFHRNTVLNLEAGTDPAEDQFKQIVDRVNTTGTVWLGTTMACAQCHNHKYDPISTKEYYELFAFFNQTPRESRQEGMQMGMSGMVYIGPNLTVERDEATRLRRTNLRSEFDETLTALNDRIAPRWDELVADEALLKKARPPVRKSLREPLEKRGLNDVRPVVRRFMKDDKEAIATIGRLEKLERELKALADYETRVMREIEEPRPTYIAKRGDFLSQGASVEPATPAILHPFPEDAPRNRLGLAQWLIDTENPVVGRVTVNRVWAEIFGQGIVPTMEEFGSQGEKPTHPDLLDWLAVVFVEDDGWSLKTLIRRIVTSGTYRQSIATHPAGLAADPPNHLLWRHPGHRLSAEAIRDNALAISGLLSPKMGGPPVKPFQPEGVWRDTAGAGEDVWHQSEGEDAYRRGIYTYWRRATHYASFANFDAPDRSACVIQRSRSNTPLQALTLMNDRAYVEMAKRFANRMATEFTGDLDTRLERAFRITLARRPAALELQILRDSFHAAGNESDGWFDVASILLNLHETINRS